MKYLLALLILAIPFAVLAEGTYNQTPTSPANVPSLSGVSISGTLDNASRIYLLRTSSSWAPLAADVCGTIKGTDEGGSNTFSGTLDQLYGASAILGDAGMSPGANCLAVNAATTWYVYVLNSAQSNWNAGPYETTVSGGGGTMLIASMSF